MIMTDAVIIKRLRRGLVLFERMGRDRRSRETGGTFGATEKAFLLTGTPRKRLRDGEWVDDEKMGEIMSKKKRYFIC